MKLQRSRYTQTLTITTSDTRSKILMLTHTSIDCNLQWRLTTPIISEWYDNLRICVFEFIRIKFTCIPSFSKITLIMSDYHIESFLMISTYLVRGKNFLTKKCFGLFWGIFKASNCKMSHCPKKDCISIITT